MTKWLPEVNTKRTKYRWPQTNDKMVASNCVWTRDAGMVVATCRSRGELTTTNHLLC